LAASGAVPPPKDGPKSPPERAPDTPRAPRVEASTAAKRQPEPVYEPHDEEPHHGLRLSSLREIIAELEAQRAIDLKYDIERYVRPAEIDFGHFRYTAAPRTPSDLSYRIKTWLEHNTGVEWEVLQSNDGAAESTSEVRQRRGREKLKAAEAHPRIAEALKVFPGARVLRVDEPEAQEELDELAAKANVIHVDFSSRERAEDAHPEPEEREDDD
jgi:hypothetical protein